MTDAVKKFRIATADGRKILRGLGLGESDVDMVAPFVKDLQDRLRLRNRLAGKASETIGRLRAEVARLRMERAEWRGTVNGDVLVEVLAASAPEGWTPEARRAHAEHVIEAMQASGIEVRRAVRASTASPWEPKYGELVSGLGFHTGEYYVGTYEGASTSELYTNASTVYSGGIRRVLRAESLRPAGSGVDGDR
jgi:hypothetical protein